MSPVQPTPEQARDLQNEIDRNRRSEYRLLPYAGLALLVVAVIAVVRLVSFS